MLISVWRYGMIKNLIMTIQNKVVIKENWIKAGERNESDVHNAQ